MCFSSSFFLFLFLFSFLFRCFMFLYYILLDDNLKIPVGSSINDVTAIGRGGKAFCSESTTALVVKGLTMGGVGKIVQIIYRRSLCNNGVEIFKQLVSSIWSKKCFHKETCCVQCHSQPKTRFLNFIYQRYKSGLTSSKILSTNNKSSTFFFHKLLQKIREMKIFLCSECLAK